MIIGIGNDIIDIRRIEKALERHGDRFKRRVFTETEVTKSEKRGNVSQKLLASSYAKRFAAKEAFAKAIGTGFSNGVFHKDIGVVNLPSGKPTIEASGGALKALQYVSQGKPVKVHLSLTDDYPWAQAFVIIECEELLP